MALVRQDLGADIQGVAAQARELTDWRSYVRKSPLVGIAVAAAVGYVAVPRKLNVETVDPATVAELARQNRIVVESKPRAAAQAGLGTTMFRLVSGVLLRTAVSLATQKVAQMMSPDTPATGLDVHRETGATG
jgi:hypothetical protein